MNYLCFDIGGTLTKYAVLTDNFDILFKDEYDTKALEGNRYILNSVLNKIEEIRKTYLIDGIAISTCGVVDTNKGEIIYANELVKDYIGTNFKKEIKEKFNLPCSVENDVNCFCLAESLKIKSDMIVLTIGTGIGGSIYLNNQIYHGAQYKAANFGQMLVNDDNEKFENVSSMRSLILKAKKLNISAKNGVELFQLYDDGDSKVINLINDYYQTLAKGICNLAYIFNSEYIVIGGGISNRLSFINELNQAIDKIGDKNYFSTTKVVAASFKNDGGVIGALVNYKKTNTQLEK